MNKQLFRALICAGIIVTLPFVLIYWGPGWATLWTCAAIIDVFVMDLVRKEGE